MSKIIFFLGVSGSGKSTIMKEILKTEKFLYVPSVTSRAMRLNDGEEQGKPYWFVSEEAFKKSIEDGEFLEWAINHKTAYYGTKFDSITEGLQQGGWPVKEIDVQGLKMIKEDGRIEGKYVTLFLDIDDVVMTQRILKRQPNIDPDNLQKRLNSAHMERDLGNELCDHVLDGSGTILEVTDRIMDLIEHKIMNENDSQD